LSRHTETTVNVRKAIHLTDTFPRRPQRILETRDQLLTTNKLLI
jgi:hypothetical protein